MCFFEVELKTKQTASLWQSEGTTTSKKAERLQELFDKGLSNQYEEEKASFEKKENGGAKFRLTDGKVFEIFESDQTMEVPIKFQVKGSTITWYFDAPKDETHQDWRDDFVYMPAAVGHLEVDGHCEKYWRGTNSLHIKKMHTRQSEDKLNHNHYRIENDRDVTPTQVAQHLVGFVNAHKLIDEAREQGVIPPSKYGFLADKILTVEEVKEISHKFNVHHVKANHVGPAEDVKVGEEVVHLPAREESLLSVYKNSKKQTFTAEDLKEWEEHKHEEEPCRSINQATPIKQKIEAIKAGMRGIGSELAKTRQVSWSKQVAITTVVTKDDKLVIK